VRKVSLSTGIFGESCLCPTLFFQTYGFCVASIDIDMEALQPLLIVDVFGNITTNLDQLTFVPFKLLKINYFIYLAII